MPYGVDAGIHAMESSRAQAPIDRTPLHSPTEQLRPPHNPVLLVCHGSQDRVQATRLQKASHSEPNCRRMLDSPPSGDGKR